MPIKNLKRTLVAVAASVASFSTLFADGAESLAETGGFVTTEAQLCFKGISIDEFGTTYLLRARMSGRSISNPGAEAQFCNRKETRDGNGDLTAVSYQLQSVEPQGSYPWMKCVIVNFTNGVGGVWAYADATTYYHYTNHFTKDMVGFDPQPGVASLATSATEQSYGAYGFELVRKPSSGMINVNFHNGNALSAADAISQVGAGEYVTTPSMWENVRVSTGAALTTQSGAVFSIGTVSGAWSAGNLSSGVDVRYAYIDENADIPNPTVTIADIPYQYYRVVVHASTDSDFRQFGYMTIGGVDYTSTYSGTGMATTPQYTVKGTASWGNSGAQNSSCQCAEGVNYLVSDVMTVSSTTVVGHRRGSSERGCIAAIQIVDMTDAVKEISQDMTWSELLSEFSATDNPEACDMVIKAVGNPTFTFDSADNVIRSFTVIGDATIAVADELYENGCFAKNILTGKVQVNLGNCTIREGWKGRFAIVGNDFRLYAQDAETISINIGGGDGTSDTSYESDLVKGSGYYGLYPAPGDAWNNISGRWQGQTKTVTLTSAKAFDGETTTTRNTIQLSGTAGNTWLWTGTSVPFLRGYLDDTAGIEVNIIGVPYSKYDVIIYATSDSANNVLNYFTINGTDYTCGADGIAVEGTGTWGAGTTAQPTLGKNAMLVSGVTGANLTVSGVRTEEDGYAKDRVTICAVQIINKGSVESSDWSANMNGSTAFNGGNGSGLSDQSGTWVNGELASITITNNADNATLTLDGEITAATLKIVSGAGKRLTIDRAAGAVLNIATYNFTECAELVGFLYDMDSSEWAKVDGNGGLRVVAYDATETIRGSYHYIGASNTLTLTTADGTTVNLGGSGTIAGDLDVAGDGSITFSGDYTTASGAQTKLGATRGTVTIAAGADVAVSSISLLNSGDNSTVVTLNVDGTLRVTSECSSDVYSQRNSHKGVLFGHWRGKDYVNVRGELLAEDTWAELAYTAPTFMTVNGGCVKVRGINGAAPGVNFGQQPASLTLTGGATLEIAEGFINTETMTNNYGYATVKSYSYNGSTGWTHPGSISFTDAEVGTTIDPCGMSIVFSGAISGAGKVVVDDSVGGGSVSFTGDLSEFTGTLAVEHGKVEVPAVTTGGCAVSVGADGVLKVNASGAAEQSLSVATLNVANGGTLSFAATKPRTSTKATAASATFGAVANVVLDFGGTSSGGGPYEILSVPTTSLPGVAFVVTKGGSSSRDWGGCKLSENGDGTTTVGVFPALGCSIILR